MPLPFFDPFQMLAQAAVVSRRLLLGTGVYLLPLRHPGPVAKQVATLDHLSEGRFLFGVGIGGEFPKEYEVAGVPINERGARLSESIEVVRELWKGKPASYDGKFFKFSDVLMTPPQGRMEAHLFGAEVEGSRLQENGKACRRVCFLCCNTCDVF